MRLDCNFWKSARKGTETRTDCDRCWGWGWGLSRPGHWHRCQSL